MKTPPHRSSSEAIRILYQTPTAIMATGLGSLFAPAWKIRAAHTDNLIHTTIFLTLVTQCKPESPNLHFSPVGKLASRPFINSFTTTESIKVVVSLY